MNRYFFIIFIIIFLVSACSTKVTPSKESWNLSMMQTSQAQRTSQFEELVGRGVIEFRWTDDEGTHKEQGDLDFWKQGNSISLRISKLGELIAWFGGQGKNFWFFDMMGEESTLTIGGEQGMFSDIEVALILLGLNPLPEGEMELHDGIVTIVDSDQRIWISNFTQDGNRPLKLSVTKGKRVMNALHRRSIRVEKENLHELNWPETGGLIDFTDNQGNTEVKISFSFLSNIVDEEPMDKVMDLEYLKEALQPSKTRMGT